LTRKRVSHAQAKSGCSRGEIQNERTSRFQQHHDRDRDVALGDRAGDLGDLDAEQHPDRAGDGDQAADEPAPRDRHLVGHGRDAAGPGRVEGELDQAPGDDHPQRALGH
jgi:hypothetical protein